MTVNGDAFILVVDDNEDNRDLLSQRLIRRGFRVRTAENGREALQVMEAESFDLVLLDIMMPEVNGYQVLSSLKQKGMLHHLPVIVISGLDDIESIVKCIELGAEDYLIKPFNSTLLRARVDASLEKKRFRDQEESYRRQIEEYNQHLETRVQNQVKDLTAAQMAIIYAMAKMAEFRDMETGSHLDRIQDYTAILITELVRKSYYASVLTPAYIDNMIKASPLHDIGKVGVSDQILLKPGKLTVEEFEIMKTHTTIGSSILRAVDGQLPGNHFISVGIEIAHSHHEKWDGTGYPDGLAGDDIPLSARILALADVYDALTSKRVYKDAVSHEESSEIITAGRGTHFDPLIVDCFNTLENEFSRINQRFKDV